MTQMFGTHFPTPSAVTGLTSTWDSDTSWLTLSWNAYAGGASLFWRTVIRRQVGSGDLEVIAEIDDAAVASFVDYDAPLGVPLLYVVTVDNGAYEGAGIQVGDLVDLLGWYIVVPGDSGHSFKIRYVVPQPARNPRTSRTARYPLGRSTALVTSSPVRRPSGSLPVEIRLTYHAQVALLRDIEEYAAINPYVILKNTDNESLRVQIDGWTESMSGQMLTTMSCNWWAVQ